MKPIVTLTLNPSIDYSCQAETVHPFRKIRTSKEQYDPGGGGINAARVIEELGGRALAVYMAGGLTGQVLYDLVAATGITSKRIMIEGATRVSQVVYETSSGSEFRFTPEGPVLQEFEWRACLAFLESLDFDYIILSGSLPRGLPIESYSDALALAGEKQARVVLDTSGEALKLGLGQGGVFLAKPSLGELESLIGRTLDDPEEQEAAALDLVRRGCVRILTVTMGGEGALLATESGTLRLAAPKVEARSAVGAGDSFIGAMTLGLARGSPPEEAFALAVATGAATAMTTGTELCRRQDVERLLEGLQAAP